MDIEPDNEDVNVPVPVFYTFDEQAESIPGKAENIYSELQKRTEPVLKVLAVTIACSFAIIGIFSVIRNGGKNDKH